MHCNDTEKGQIDSHERTRNDISVNLAAPFSLSFAEAEQRNEILRVILAHQLTSDVTTPGLGHARLPRLNTLTSKD